MNKQFLVFFFLLLVVFSCTRCKEDCNDPTNPDCPNYVPPVDPCAGKNIVSADFTISQRAASGGPEYHTIVPVINNVQHGYSRIVLHANENYAQYTWVIGMDTIHTRDYEFTISEQYEGQTIPLKLIVQKTPDLTCFPNDNGMDTLVKYVHVISGCDASIYGLWKGVLTTSPLDSMEVLINNSTNPSLPFDCLYRNIYGLNGDITDSCGMYISGGTDIYLKFENNFIGCSSPKGSLMLTPDLNHIQIDYSLQVGTVITHYIFNGRRIN